MMSNQITPDIVSTVISTGKNILFFVMMRAMAFHFSVLNSSETDTEFFKEGLILCDKKRMKGPQGVGLDVLVGILPCLEKEMEEIVLHKTFKLAEKVASIMEEPEPFLSRVYSSVQFFCNI
ncbi:hypothetical protein QYE76_032212 [Lolium multiflorum]|uniref:Uncharacterized protein n=1 Tax=Lolium multiflorum TaxID=4521 RepID=A0AAD8VJ63_LOLMU|nr:hypothetical protein QYE76_032212 [Lolium multiflorum]